MAAHQAPPSLGFSRQEHWSGLPFPSPMHESEKWKWKWNRAQVSATPWTLAHQAPPSMGFSRQEYWSGVPVPSPVTCKLVSQHLILCPTCSPHTPFWASSKNINQITLLPFLKTSNGFVLHFRVKSKPLPVAPAASPSSHSPPTPPSLFLPQPCHPSCYCSHTPSSSQPQGICDGHSPF